MSEIKFPTVKLQEFRLDVQIPNVIRHSSIYSAKEQVFSRGNMFFAGRIGWARRFMDKEDEIKAIEAFLAACYGAVNTFKVPVPYDQTERFAGDTGLTISAVTTDGTFDSEFTATAGLKAGDYCNFGDRLHKIVEADDTSYKVVPGIMNSETVLKWHSPVLHARLATDSIDLPRSGHSAGPWQLEIQEVL